MTTLALPLLIHLLSTGIPGVAPRSDVDGRSAEIERLLQGHAEYRSFSGAVAVAEGGETLYAGAFGLASREWGVPNEVHTRFSIASVTKPFTAALVLRLVDEGVLTLDAAVSDVLPGYPVDPGARITVHHLLSHSSGLANYARKAFWEGNESRMDHDPDEFVQRYCTTATFAPGTSGLYSDANYVLLARIVEAVTGTSFAEAMRAHVLEPIGAGDTGHLDGETVVPRLARGYMRRGEAHWLSAPIDYRSVQLGAGDMYSTVGDLLTFEARLRGDLLSEASREAAFTAHAPSGFEGQSNGYGWNLGELVLRSGRRIAVRHAPGNNAGFAALLYAAPESGRTVAVIQNTGPGYLDMRVYTICEEILHVLHGEEAQVPPFGLADRVGRVVRRDGVAAAREVYERWLEGPDPDLDLRAMNRLGYDLLAEGRLDAAVAVLELNVRSDPEGWNAHDSLAEALFTAGDLERAAEHCRLSLERDDGNANARRMLAQIEGE